MMNTDLNWHYDLATNSMHNATATTDVLFGSSATSTGAPAYFDLSGGTTGSSTFYFGHATNSNVVIGGTSTTVGFMNSAYSLNGNDLFVGGNIGSVSSIYTNGAFVAGTGTTRFGNGFISKNDAGHLQIGAVSGTSFTNGIEQLWSSSSNPEVAANVSLSYASTTIIRGHYAYVTTNTDLKTIDISDPTHPVLTSTLAMGATTKDITQDEKYIYVALNDDSIMVIDTVIPSTPVIQNTSFGIPANEIFVEGIYLYAITSAGVDIYRINGTGLIFTGSYSTAGVGNAMAVHGKYLYIGDSSSVYVVDISTPATPANISTFALGQAASHMIADDHYVYITTPNNSALSIVDISNPASLSLAKTVSGMGGSYTLSKSGRYVYVTSAAGFNVVDVQTTSTAAITKTITGVTLPQSFIVTGRYGYGIDGAAAGALKVYDLQGSEFANLTAGSLETGNARILGDMSISHRLSVDGGIQVGNGGIVSEGALLVNATDISSIFKGSVDIDGTLTAGALYAYGVTSNLVPNPGPQLSLGSSLYKWDGYFRSASVESLTVLPRNNTYFDSTVLSSSLVIGGHPQGIYVDDRYVYSYGTNNGLEIIDVTDPSNPTITASTTLGGDFQVNQFLANGSYMMFGGVSGTVTGAVRAIGLSDMSTTTQQMTLGLATYAVNGIASSGALTYAISTGSSTLYIIGADAIGNFKVIGSLTGLGAPTYVAASDGYAYVVDETNSTLKIIDVRDPLTPVVKSTLTFSVFPGTNPKQIQVQGKRAYVAYGPTAFSILDVSDPTAPTILSTKTCTGLGCDRAQFDGEYIYGRSYDMGQSRYNVSVIDVHDGTNPTIISTIGYTANPQQIQYFHKQGSLMYIVSSDVFLGVTATTSSFTVIDMGGLKSDGLQVGNAEIGNATVRGSIRVGGDISAKNGLSSGMGGLFTTGPILALGTARSLIKPGLDTGSLMVGGGASATGTANYAMVIKYASSTSFGGLCLDDTTTASTCPTTVTGTSILADNSITANAFDLAETYSVTGAVTPGDVVMMDPSASSTVKLADGTPYNPKVLGIVSTRAGFVLGWNEGAQVALSGHVPTHVNMENGPILVGDALTTSHVPGEAMKATKAGMIIGYALEDVSTTGTAEVFVAVGYSAGAVIGNDGTFTTIADNVLMGPSGVASVSNAAVDSWGLTFRGQAWEASSTSVVNRDFTLVTDVISATSSAFTIKSASGTSLFTLDEQGNASFNGDVQLGGRLFLSDRGAKQSDYYVFLDNQGASGTYIGTNADGWQSLDTYDFAERFYSPDALEPGDLVIVSNAGVEHVQRSYNVTDMLVGIVSTRPAFIAGRPATDTYPIALTGRVPTKVSNMNGVIKAGDPLSPSTMPGVAVKATQSGPIVGLALEDFDGVAIDKINVYVNPGWWAAPSSTETAVSQTVINNTTVTSDTSAQRRGLAKIDAGSSQVHVSFDSVNAYPFVQVTPRGLITGGWGTDHYTDTGFDIILSEPQGFDAYFSWQVEALGGSDRLYQSDGTYLDLNQMTGQPIGGQTPTTTLDVVTSTDPVIVAPTSSEPVIDTSSSTTTSTI
ncbi:MAG: hypothetical protein WCK01_05760 [Candidatus Uhrbacteria bacterium]